MVDIWSLYFTIFQGLGFNISNKKSGQSRQVAILTPWAHGAAPTKPTRLAYAAKKGECPWRSRIPQCLGLFAVFFSCFSSGKSRKKSVDVLECLEILLGMLMIVDLLV